MSSIDHNESKHYSRNKSSSFEATKGGKGDVVKNEVEKLFGKKDGVISHHDIQKLKNKYNDGELVEQITAAFAEKQKQINKKASKFAKLIREKYANSNYPFHKLLERAKKYKKKYDLSDSEFEEFKRQYEMELAGYDRPDVYIPQTNMSKILGKVSIDTTGSGFKVSDDDFRVLQELMRLYEETKPLHSQVILQSMTYTDCAYEALNGKYRQEFGNNPGNHVHPVIAALFLPKIQVVEDHFLFANVAGIVKARYKQEPLRTKPDYEVFYSLVTDPNDVVCDRISPIKDLLNRSNLQQQLWNSVLNLRNGQYYNKASQEFLMAIDLCKLNKWDTPDLVYGRYDGTVIKRLVSAFSFRPTVVATTPTYNLVSNNPYTQNFVPQVTSLPMVNLRLPLSINDSDPVELREALEQQQFFIEGGQIVPKNQSLIYSRGLLIFYVDRRSHTLRVGDINPFNFNRLPAAIAGFERLNQRRVIFEPEFKLREDSYKLRSVVLCETNNKVDANKKLIIGSSTVIMTHPNISSGRFDAQYLHYDPLGVRDSYYSSAQDSQQTNGPITIIPGTRDLSAVDNETNFNDMAETRGTIFIYELEDSSKGEIRY